MNITEIVVAVIGLLGTIITVVVVPLIRQKLGAEQQTELAKWVRIAVSAAEQMFNEQGKGYEKFQYVLNWLKENGVDLDDTKVLAEVKLLIEAFVAEMNGKSRMV